MIREATLGKDDPMTATTMSNLANQLVTDGDYAGVAPTLRECAGDLRDQARKGPPNDGNVPHQSGTTA